mgnify:CR=1 FL=1
MNVSRRGFLKISGAVAAVSGLGITLKSIAAHARELKIMHAKETTTVCPYCSVGCSICLLYTSDAADDLLCVDLGGRRIIKQKNKKTNI